MNDVEVKKYLQNNVENFNPTVTFEQVWNKYSYKKSKNKRIFFRPKLVSIISAAILFLIIVPVSAAVLPIKWNGIKITIDDDNGKNAPNRSTKGNSFRT